MSKVRLIVGLSNTEQKYARTRHNAGLWYLDALAKYHNQVPQKDMSFLSYTKKIGISDKSIYLLSPKSAMNLSGKPVVDFARFHQIPTEEILVVHDDLALQPGVAKFKYGGGHGGHNGLRDIIKTLGGGNNFHRLRIGIGHPGSRYEVASFVLSKPSLAEKKLIQSSIDQAVLCTQLWIEDSYTRALNNMNSFKAL
jgi:PTH1 family peptidyl-tRNA hydrolase